MQTSGLGVIEKKVFGALMILANDDMVATTTLRKIAEVMGYKEVGGALTYAIKVLEMKNFIARTGKGQYQVLL